MARKCKTCGTEYTQPGGSGHCSARCREQHDQTKLALNVPEGPMGRVDLATVLEVVRQDLGFEPEPGCRACKRACVLLASHRQRMEEMQRRLSQMERALLTIQQHADLATRVVTFVGIDRR